MLRKISIAFLTAVTLTACSGAPAIPLLAPGRSYELRPDLCEVLDYKAFSPWFGNVYSFPDSAPATDTKVRCRAENDLYASLRLHVIVGAYKYDSPEDAKKLFDRCCKEPSDMDVKLKTKVDDARYFKDYSAVVLDGNLYLKVSVHPSATDETSFRDELPRLTVDLTDQVLERLREKS